MAQEAKLPCTTRLWARASRSSTRPRPKTHDQAQVLRTALHIYPATLTLDELVRELTVASPDFSEQDRIQRAVRDLTAGGLIQRIGELVMPTRAAVNFNALPRE